jgi:hypothetical protein
MAPILFEKLANEELAEEILRIIYKAADVCKRSPELNKTFKIVLNEMVDKAWVPVKHLSLNLSKSGPASTPRVATPERQEPPSPSICVTPVSKKPPTSHRRVVSAVLS